MKKCVFVCPSKTWGGVEKNVVVRAEFLIKKGYKVYVIILNNQFREKFEKVHNLEIISIKSRGSDANIFVMYNYIKIFKKIKVNTIFVASKKDWFIVSLAAKISRVSRIILYLGIKRNIKNNIKYYFLLKKLKPLVLVNSDSLKNHLLNTTSFFNSNNLFRIHNGFMNIEDINEMKPLNLKNKFNLSKNTILIGCAGRLSPMKGFDLLPSILKRLPNNYHIIHVGKGNEVNEKEIKEHINRTLYSNRIHFYGYLDDIHPFFNEIDIFLLCSRNEGMANVLNEALSHGKPCVSTKVSGSEELLDHGKYGILTEINDVRAMAEGIYKIASKQINFSSEDSKRWIQNNFSLRLMEEKTETLFFGNLNNL